MTYVSGDLRDQLADLGRSVVRAGLVVGSGGNLSGRIADTDECWVTAAGTWLDRLDHGSFARIPISGPVNVTDSVSESRPDVGGLACMAGPGRPVNGRTSDGGLAAGGRSDEGAEATTSLSAPSPTPTSELGLHLAVYRARPDANVVVHLHPQTVLLLEALGEPIRLATTDHAYYLRRIAVLPYHRPGTAEVGESAAGAVTDGTDCVVLARHGCCVLADSVELAHKRVLYLEEAAQLTYRALQLGRVRELDDVRFTL